MTKDSEWEKAEQSGYMAALQDIADLCVDNYEEIVYPKIVEFLHSKGFKTAGEIQSEVREREYQEKYSLEALIAEGVRRGYP